MDTELPRILVLAVQQALLGVVKLHYQMLRNCGKHFLESPLSQPLACPELWQLTPSKPNKHSRTDDVFLTWGIQVRSQRFQRDDMAIKYQSRLPAFQRAFLPFGHSLSCKLKICFQVMASIVESLMLILKGYRYSIGIEMVAHSQDCCKCCNLVGLESAQNRYRNCGSWSWQTEA